MLAEPKNQEESFEGFAEEENQRFEAARKKAKEAPLDEHLRKIIIDYIYNNLINVINGQKIDHSLADINPECQEIIEALSAFEREEGFALAPEQKDIFEFLKDYDQAKDKFKTKQKLSDEKLQQINNILTKKGYNKQHMILALTLDVLAEVIKKDAIKDMIARHNLEKRATVLTEEIMSNQNEAVAYARVMGDINNVLDKYGSLDGIKKEFTDQKRLAEIKSEINRIIDKELQSLELKEYEYAKMSQPELNRNKTRLIKIKNVEPLEVFDIDNYGFIGLLLERRNDKFAKIQDDYEKINKRIYKYLP